jgi:hypothetical protein
MGTTDQVEILLFAEYTYILCTKCETHSPLILAPSIGLLVRIAPKEVAEQSAIRYICGFLDFLDLFQRLQFGRQPPMHAQDTIINECGNRETVEYIDEEFP